MRRSLWCTSALVGIGLGSSVASAAEVTPGGALDVEISGFARFLAIGGDVDNFLLDDSVSTGLDFFNDTEVHFTAKGEDDTTGTEYGATIEFEADTNATENTDETWLFLRGGWGEARFGDEDGAADNDGLSVNAANISDGVGTDGLEGDQWEVFAGGTRTYEPLGTSDSTKIRYYTPEFGGLQFGVSYTPNLNEINSGSDNGDDVAIKDVEAGDVVEGALRYEGELGGLDLTAGVSGLYGDIKDEDASGGDDYWALQGGLIVGLFGLDVGGGYLKQEAGEIETDSITFGVGAGFGPAIDDDDGELVRVALTYGRFLDTDDLTVNDNELGEPWLVILSATLGLMPGLTLAGDVGYFDNDVEGEEVGTSGDDGWQAVGRLGVAF